MYIYLFISIYIYKAGFKKRKMIRNFREMMTHFGKVIRNVFAFWHHIHKIRLKRGNIVYKKVFLQCYLKKIRKSAKVICSLRFILP